MASPSKKFDTKYTGMRRAVTIAVPNERTARRQRFEAMQKLIKPKEEKPDDSTE